MEYSLAGCLHVYVSTRDYGPEKSWTRLVYIKSVLVGVSDTQRHCLDMHKS